MVSPKIKIILDPVLSASAGFNFQSNDFINHLIDLYENLFLLTPNAEEVLKLTRLVKWEEAAKIISEHCAVFLKGGHHQGNIKGIDMLFEKGAITGVIYPQQKVEKGKHGSGCVLSSAIAANIAKGINLAEACKKGKAYTEDFLNSTESLLGYHKR